MLHLILSVNGSADYCAPPPPAPKAKRYRVAAGRGVSCRAKCVSRLILRRGTGLQALGLRAEHLDYAAYRKRYTGRTNDPPCTTSRETTYATCAYLVH